MHRGDDDDQTADPSKSHPICKEKRVRQSHSLSNGKQPSKIVWAHSVSEAFDLMRDGPVHDDSLASMIPQAESRLIDFNAKDQ